MAKYLLFLLGCNLVVLYGYGQKIELGKIVDSLFCGSSNIKTIATSYRDDPIISFSGNSRCFNIDWFNKDNELIDILKKRRDCHLLTLLRNRCDGDTVNYIFSLSSVNIASFQKVRSAVWEGDFAVSFKKNGNKWYITDVAF